MRFADIVLTIAAPWMAVLAGLVIPVLTAVVTKDLTGWIQVVILGVLSAVAGIVAQGLGADWSFPVVHTLSQIGWVALVAVAAHYGFNISGVLQKVGSATRGFGFGWSHPGQGMALVGPTGPVGGSGAAPLVVTLMNGTVSAAASWIVAGQLPRRPGLRGRLPVKAPAERFPIRFLHEYLAQPLPPPTYPIDVSGGITDWKMLGNGPDPTLTANHAKPVGDCVFAARQHYRMAKAAGAGMLATETWETSDDLVTEYLAYDQGHDVGANMADALLAWYKAGKILAFAPVDLSDRGHADAALEVFRGLLCGVQLTPGADRLFEEHGVWTVGRGQRPDPQEGHCVVQVGASGPTRADIDGFVTWGALQRAHVTWTAACRDEAWVIITSEDQVDADALAAMKADIDVLGGTQAAE